MSTFSATFAATQAQLPATDISGVHTYAAPASPSSSRSSSPLSSSSSSLLSQSYTDEYRVDILYGPRLRIIPLPALSDEGISPVKDVDPSSSFAGSRRPGQLRRRRNDSIPPSPKSLKLTVFDEFFSSNRYTVCNDMATYHDFSTYTPPVPPAYMCYAPITQYKSLPRYTLI